MVDNAFSMKGTNHEIGISKVEVQRLQEKGDFVNTYFMCKYHHFQTGHQYFIRDSNLILYVKDNKLVFETIVLAGGLTNHVLKLAHDKMGHHGFTKA